MLLSDDHYRAIGRIAVEAGDIEFFLDQLVVRLMRQDPDGALTLIAGMQFAQLADRVRNLAKLRLPEDSRSRAAIIEWLPLAKAAMDARNTQLHAAWHVQYDLITAASTTRRVKRDKAGIRRVADVTVEELVGIGVDLAVVVAKAGAMFHAIDAELGPVEIGLLRPQPERRG